MALAREVGRLQPVASNVAWVGADHLHVTLKFLGATDEDRLPAVREALARAAGTASAFTLALRGLGAFPTPSRPRVIWAGAAEGAGALAALAGTVDRELVALGVPPETRPFASHVTLGRVREPRRAPRLAEALATASERVFGTVTVDRLTLMRSDLSPRGARYTELAGFALG